MDFNTIAKDAFAAILPTLTLIGEGTVKSIGSDIWELIKKPFKLNDKSKGIIEQLEKNPDDPKLQGIAEYKLAEYLEEDPSLAEALLNHLEDFKKHDEMGSVNFIGSKNVVNSKCNTGNIVVGDNISGNYFAGRDVIIKSDYHKREIDQLIRILNNRANSIVKNLNSQYEYANIKKYLEAFKVLHEEHVKALTDDDLIYAHEILGKIHALSYEIESDEFWTRHSIKTPDLMYNLCNNAFTDGKLISMYTTGNMEGYFEKCFDRKINSTNKDTQKDEILKIYKQMIKWDIQI